jgi:hypothetical protein
MTGLRVNYKVFGRKSEWSEVLFGYDLGRTEKNHEELGYTVCNLRFE